MNGTIIRQLHGRCLELTIDNPAHDNAMSDDMARELADLLDAAADEADLVVLRGAGADFCSGRMSMGKRSGTQPQALDRRRKTEVIFRCYDAFRATPVPVIGVVRGRAHGFGCAIAGLCDITLAASTASFQIPEMAHNILPTMVMSALIDRMPAKELAYLVYSTREIDAAAARAYGLVSEVVPDAGLDAAFEALRTRDAEHAAAGAMRRQGISALGAGHEHPWRGGLRPEPARDRQLFERNAQAERLTKPGRTMSNNDTPFDFDKFRLRRFVEKLIDAGEVAIHEDPVSLADLSARIDETPKASLFRQVGQEKFEMIAAVSGSRKRLAMAFGVEESELIAEYTRRMANPQTVRRGVVGTCAGAPDRPDRRRHRPHEAAVSPSARI